MNVLRSRSASARVDDVADIPRRAADDRASARATIRARITVGRATQRRAPASGRGGGGGGGGGDTDEDDDDDEEVEEEEEEDGGGSRSESDDDVEALSERAGAAVSIS